MSVGGLAAKRSFSEKLAGYLQDADYRIAATTSERNRIFQLRYRCYLRESAILPNLRERFEDTYDRMDNCWLFGIHMDGELVSSIRFHVTSPQAPYGPALDVFPDVVRPMIEKGLTVIDPTRLVVDTEAAKHYPELAYVTMRVACMASEYFEAAYCLATVRAEHQAFYRRIFGFRKMCEPRPYPTLLKPISLLAGDMALVRDVVAERYPIFVSSFTERRMLFEQPKSEAELLQEQERFFPRAVNG